MYVRMRGKGVFKVLRMAKSLDSLCSGLYTEDEQRAFDKEGSQRFYLQGRSPMGGRSN